MENIRLVYYINQFFGGIGGEESAEYLMQAKEGAIGPGNLLQKLLNDENAVKKTIICGDNEFNEHEQDNIQKIFTVIEEIKPDMFVAGPAFTSGRYGLACLKACVAVAEKFGIPCITGVHPENPAVGLQDKQKHVYVIPVGKSAATMKEAIQKMAGLINKIISNGEDHLSVHDGFLPRGIRKNIRVADSAPERACHMLLDKIKSLPFRSEIELEHFEVIPAPQAIKDIKKVKIALVTEAGLVPPGNPHGIQAARASKWAKYNISALDDFQEGSFHSIHGGYDSQWVDKDPDRVLPLDALRYFEHNHEIGQVADCFYSTCGSMGQVITMKKIGEEIAADILEQKIGAVVLTGT
ncbi:glycine/betaine/sarcosine/D-proline family reductase selenoprotein B [Desulfitobacterium sp. AusDCA]|uniref:glycine/betaine/sarcosine/D-proline family reductase selenoprotein B n=1 Tax=Desulfitobacterium sp. AusDCA TaxID=3240383 RepID=UPI003DA72E7C